MLSTSTTANPNYLAKIVQLGAPIKHPNADRMQGFQIDGNIIYSDLSKKEGDVCVYFPLECVISHVLLSQMNLYSSPEQNVDPTIKGYFPKTGRVRAVRLRGEPSNGFLLPWKEVESILGEFYSTDTLLNKEFDTWNDTLLVWKYVPQVDGPGKEKQTKGQNKVKRYSKLVENQFRLHEDTQQLRKNIHRISPSDIISISYKLHGTSFVVGNVLTKKKRSFKERIKAAWNTLTNKGNGLLDTGYTYDYVYASRNVVKNQYESAKSQHYYSYDLWEDIKNVLAPSIEKGFTLYGEAVGYTRTGQTIQKGYDYGYTAPTVDHLDAEGNRVTGVAYKEGIHYGVYIYRITSTNLDGSVIELSMSQIKEYCNKYNLKHVPITWVGEVSRFQPVDTNEVHNPDEAREKWHHGLLQKFEKSLFCYQNIDCYMCKTKVPAEGVVVRVDKLNSFEAYKLKSFKFLEHETKQLDEGIIDMESEQSTASEL